MKVDDGWRRGFGAVEWIWKANGRCEEDCEWKKAGRVEEMHCERLVESSEEGMLGSTSALWMEKLFHGRG